MGRGKKTNTNQPSLFKKKVPAKPEGYYSGDKTNPNLRAFVAKHIKEHPYDPNNDDYDLRAFCKPIKTTKANRIYNIHPYWSKKPPDAIEEYIIHYTKIGDLVLDPFCGSGTTALAAIQNGRKAIAIDLSPAATFISRTFCTWVSPDKIREAYQKIVASVSPTMDWLYETQCDRCGGQAKISHTVLSATFQCTRCLAFVPIYRCEKRKIGKRTVTLCPMCFEKGITEEISPKRNIRGDLIPVEVYYDCLQGCKPARYSRSLCDHRGNYTPTSFDRNRNKEIEKGKIPYWYPDSDLPFPTLSHRLYRQGIRKQDQLFTKRNLWALSALRKAIFDEIEDPLRLSILSIFTSILIKCSHLMGHGTDGVGRVFSGAYYPQSVRQEVNIMKYFKLATNTLIKGIEDVENVSQSFDQWDVIISTQPAQELSELPDNSVDYIFTDPPYADKVPFWELNIIWEAWLGFSSDWEDRELVLNERRNKSHQEYHKIFLECFREAFRVLKPGRWMSITYHDTSEGTWHLVQDIMAQLGFLVDQAEQSLFIDATTPTIHHIKDSKIVKRDLVVNFRKPRLGEFRNEVIINGNEDKKTFNEKVRLIINEYLSEKPGSTKDRVYDEVVSRMIRAGQMEPYNFETLLRQVAEEVVTPVMKNLFEQKDPDLFGTHEMRRWYIKETEITKQDEAEASKEDKASQMLSAFIKDFLDKNPEQEGVHYSDLFEHYVYKVNDKPRRHLAEFIPDYFYKTESGTWRLPASEDEERLKAEGRAKGTLRRIKRYISFIEQDMPVPEKERPNDATLAEWIRHSKRSGLYEQGKLLYEKGGLNLDGLSDEDQADVEEDYLTCVRNLSRGR